MLHFEVGRPVAMGRHVGHLGPLDSTHHYCRAGLAPSGDVLAVYAMHPDRTRPAGSCVPIVAPGSRNPIYKFRPRRVDPTYPWPVEHVLCRSGDGGSTWGECQPLEGCSVVTIGARLLSPYRQIHALEPGLAVGAFQVSDDDGVTWYDRPDVLYRYPTDLRLSEEVDPTTGTRVVLDFENAGAHQAVADGSLVVFATASRQDADGARWWFPLMFRSTDGGATFDFVACPTGTDRPVDHHGYTEPALACLPGGDLLAVFRTEYHQPDRILMQCRSADGGLTWTAPAACPGVPRHYPLRQLRPVANRGKTHLNAASVSPALCTLTNGVVALTYGRPGVHLAFSEDGSGEVWTDRLAVVPEHSLFGANDSGSAMSGLVPVSDDTVLLIYDVYNWRDHPDAVPGNTVFALRVTVRSV
ncbi:MAG: sialidase family protein [Gemmatimonadota bacterium]